MAPKLSIIIPCYNSEKTLEKTLESVLNQTYQDWEAIIINDGSTDITETIARTWVNKDHRIKCFSKSNQGLGKTRNFGIAKAVGEYILPLDSDNLIEPDFAIKAIEIMDSNNEIGVVHGHAEFFGERRGIWKIAEFNLEKLFVQNYIDACAIYRKSLWEQVRGYDENMPYQGNEDWDLWLAFGIIDVIFFHLNKVTFKYRVNKNSMNRSYTPDIKKTNELYIVRKYAEHYYLFFKENRLLLHKYQEDTRQGFFRKYGAKMKRRISKYFRNPTVREKFDK